MAAHVQGDTTNHEDGNYTTPGDVTFCSRVVATGRCASSRRTRIIDRTAQRNTCLRSLSYLHLSIASSNSRRILSPPRDFHSERHLLISPMLLRPVTMPL